jgi:hypothetical protein
LGTTGRRRSSKVRVAPAGSRSGIVVLATACQGSSSLDPDEPPDTGGNDAAVPRVCGPRACTYRRGLKAEVRGSLTYDATQDCFLLDLEGIQYPVVWPAGTTGTSDGPGVVLPDGSTVRVGEVVSAGGGYLQVAGEYQIPTGCLPKYWRGRDFQRERLAAPGRRLTRGSATQNGRCESLVPWCTAWRSALGFGQSALVECSFCGNSQEAQPDGRRVIGGPRGVAICSDCVRLCAEILEAKPPGGTPPRVWTTTTHGSTSD